MEKEGAELVEKMEEVSRAMAECGRKTAESISRMTEGYRSGEGGGQARGRRDEDDGHAWE